ADHHLTRLRCRSHRFCHLRPNLGKRLTLAHGTVPDSDVVVVGEECLGKGRAHDAKTNDGDCLPCCTVCHYEPPDKELVEFERHLTPQPQPPRPNHSLSCLYRTAGGPRSRWRLLLARAAPFLLFSVPYH